MNKAISCTVLAVAAAMVGCGGGGGGSGADSGSGGGVATPTTFDQVVPGTTMAWDTSRSGAFAVTVTNAAGTAAANAAVRVFTMTMVNPDDGTPLDEPVALDLIDTAVTDGGGQVSFDTRLPDSLTEVLVVVTWDDQKAIRRVTLASNVNSLAVSTAL
jgi:hypothetical protein